MCKGDGTAISSSFVHDSVCDCCDGSDELAGRCTDSCIPGASRSDHADGCAAADDALALVREGELRLAARRHLAARECFVAASKLAPKRAPMHRGAFDGLVSLHSKGVRLTQRTSEAEALIEQGSQAAAVEDTGSAMNHFFAALEIDPLNIDAMAVHACTAVRARYACVCVVGTRVYACRERAVL